jgi:hypothetical protein
MKRRNEDERMNPANKGLTHPHTLYVTTSLSFRN